MNVVHAPGELAQEPHVVHAQAHEVRRVVVDADARHPHVPSMPLLGEHLSLSAVNGPDFCVVSGPSAALTLPTVA